MHIVVFGDILYSFMWMWVAAQCLFRMEGFFSILCRIELLAISFPRIYRPKNIWIAHPQPWMIWLHWVKSFFFLKVIWIFYSILTITMSHERSSVILRNFEHRRNIFATLLCSFFCDFWQLTVSQDVDLFGWSLKCDFLILFILFRKISFLSILSLSAFLSSSILIMTILMLSFPLPSFLLSFIHSFSTLLSSTHWIISVDLFANNSLFFCQFKAVHFLLYFFCF